MWPLSEYWKWSYWFIDSIQLMTAIPPPPPFSTPPTSFLLLLPFPPNHCCIIGVAMVTLTYAFSPSTQQNCTWGQFWSTTSSFPSPVPQTSAFWFTSLQVTSKIPSGHWNLMEKCSQWPTYECGLIKQRTHSTFSRWIQPSVTDYYCTIWYGTLLYPNHPATTTKLQERAQ